MSFYDLTISSERDEYPRHFAEVESWHIGDEDHGMFSFNINFRFGSSGQGLGHYCLGSDEHGWVDVGFLHKITRVLGPVQNWKGRQCLVLHETADWNARIVGIETLPTALEVRTVIFKEAFEGATVETVTDERNAE